MNYGNCGQCNEKLSFENHNRHNKEYLCNNCYSPIQKEIDYKRNLKEFCNEIFKKSESKKLYLKCSINEAYEKLCSVIRIDNNYTKKIPSIEIVNEQCQIIQFKYLPIGKIMETWDYWMRVESVNDHTISIQSFIGKVNNKGLRIFLGIIINLVLLAFLHIFYFIISIPAYIIIFLFIVPYVYAKRKTYLKNIFGPNVLLNINTQKENQLLNGIEILKD